MFYDKKEVVLLYFLIIVNVVSLSLLIFQHTKLLSLSKEMAEIKDQTYNYVQAPHLELAYLLTPKGMFINSINDFGNFSGSSMQPAMFQGNTLLEIKYTNQSLKPGQIIRYLNGEDIPIIHRIRAVYEDSIYVQGDNLGKGERVAKNRITHLVVGVLYT